MNTAEEGTPFDTGIKGSSLKGRNESPNTKRKRPREVKYDRFAIALETATRFRDREAEFRKQHGPVKIIIQNGQPVAK